MAVLGIGSEELTIDDILAFFDSSAGEILVGSGPGSSADARLKVLRNMLEAAAYLIEAELFEDACQQLQDAYDRCDGESPPPDFVKDGEVGIEAVAVLNTMILELMVNLECF